MCKRHFNDFLFTLTKVIYFSLIASAFLYNFDSDSQPPGPENMLEVEQTIEHIQTIGNGALQGVVSAVSHACDHPGETLFNVALGSVFPSALVAKFAITNLRQLYNLSQDTEALKQFKALSADDQMSVVLQALGQIWGSSMLYKTMGRSIRSLASQAGKNAFNRPFAFNVGNNQGGLVGFTNIKGFNGIAAFRQADGKPVPFLYYMWKNQPGKDGTVSGSAGNDFSFRPAYKAQEDQSCFALGVGQSPFLVQVDDAGYQHMKTKLAQNAKKYALELSYGYTFDCEGLKLNPKIQKDSLHGKHTRFEDYLNSKAIIHESNVQLAKYISIYYYKYFTKQTSLDIRENYFDFVYANLFNIRGFHNLIKYNPVELSKTKEALKLLVINPSLISDENNAYLKVLLHPFKKFNPSGTVPIAPDVNRARPELETISYLLKQKAIVEQGVLYCAVPKEKPISVVPPINPNNKNKSPNIIVEVDVIYTYAGKKYAGDVKSGDKFLKKFLYNAEDDKFLKEIIDARNAAWALGREYVFLCTHDGPEDAKKFIRNMGIHVVVRGKDSLDLPITPRIIEWYDFTPAGERILKSRDVIKPPVSDVSDPAPIHVPGVGNQQDTSTTSALGLSPFVVAFLLNPNNDPEQENSGHVEGQTESVATEDYPKSNEKFSSGNPDKAFDQTAGFEQSDLRSEEILEEISVEELLQNAIAESLKYSFKDTQMPDLYYKGPLPTVEPYPVQANAWVSLAKGGALIGATIGTASWVLTATTGVSGGNLAIALQFAVFVEDPLAVALGAALSPITLMAIPIGLFVYMSSEEDGDLKLFSDYYSIKTLQQHVIHDNLLKTLDDVINEKFLRGKFFNKCSSLPKNVLGYPFFIVDNYKVPFWLYKRHLFVTPEQKELKELGIWVRLDIYPELETRELLNKTAELVRTFVLKIAGLSIAGLDKQVRTLEQQTRDYHQQLKDRAEAIQAHEVNFIKSLEECFDKGEADTPLSVLNGEIESLFVQLYHLGALYKLSAVKAHAAKNLFAQRADSLALILESQRDALFEYQKLNKQLALDSKFAHTDRYKKRADALEKAEANDFKLGWRTYTLSGVIKSNLSKRVADPAILEKLYGSHVQQRIYDEVIYIAQQLDVLFNAINGNSREQSLKYILGGMSALIGESLEHAVLGFVFKSFALDDVAYALLDCARLLQATPEAGTLSLDVFYVTAAYVAYLIVQTLPEFHEQELISEQDLSWPAHILSFVSLVHKNLESFWQMINETLEKDKDTSVNLSVRKQLFGINLLLLGAQQELKETADARVLAIHRELANSMSSGYASVLEKQKVKIALKTPIAFLVGQVQSLLHAVKLFCQKHPNYDVAHVLSYLALNPARIASFYGQVEAA